MESNDKILLEQRIKQLKSIRGSGTELITLYIPAEQPIHFASEKLRNELSTVSNIKSKQTKTAVEDGLRKLLNQLKVYGNNAPKNGLALFVNEFGVDAFEPPLPVRTGRYWCDSVFDTSPLEAMTKSTKKYGLIVMDGRDATIALLDGYSIKYLDSLHSLAHSKAGKGGQSKRRFERIREESIDLYYKRIGASANKHFLGTEGIFISGPGPVKEDLKKANPFDYRIKVLGLVECGYTEEQGVRETLGKLNEIIGEQELLKERRDVENFLKELRNNGLVEYGISAVLGSHKQKRVKSILLSDALIDKIPYDISDVPTQLISSKTDEGMQFLYMTGGIAAYLKY